MENRLARLKNTRVEKDGNAKGVEYSYFGGIKQFPLVIQPTYSGLILTEWLKQYKDEFDEALHKHGAILLRGFHINTVEKFQEFIDVFGMSPLEYRQRSSPRYEVARNVYHSTTYPADQHINMHSENSYTLNYASKIIFCCIQPAEKRGETPIADNRMVLACLPEALREKFLTRGVKYVRNMSKDVGLPWQEVFQTNDRSEVETECGKSNMEFEWKEGDKLRISWNNQAIYEHPVTTEQVWFNHSFFFNKYAMEQEVLESFKSEEEIPFNTYFGDGSAITKEEIGDIRSAYEQATILFPWEKGDVLYMDNMLMSHGRSPYKGERQIIVSMF
jgi:alpha-ketoglutarate-dependent taurine dioxygenase